MVRITIDAEMREKLLSSGEIVELCDESGEVLGRITPRNARIAQEYTRLAADFTDEELKASREDQRPGMSTAELIAYLHRER